MSVNQPKNLESDFNNLSINPLWKKTYSQCRTCKLCTTSRKDYSFKNILVTPNCTCKIAKKQRPKSSIVRPAKLNLPITNKKNIKSVILKPATFILSSEKSVIPEPSVSKKITKLQSSLPNSEGKVFINDKNDSQSSFKALLPKIDTDILKAFDTLSFKELRIQPPKPNSHNDSSGLTVKRENNSSNSCSIQARMEPSLYSDCDDTSIEELASYFDLFVHIPKKMSSMAEMMYI